MELNLSYYPLGGYGLVLFDGVKNRNVVTDLEPLQPYVTNVTCESLNGDKHTMQFREFLDICSQQNICVKMFHTVIEALKTPYEKEKHVVKMLAKRLSQQELTSYTPYTSVSTKYGDVCFIEISLHTPVSIKLGNGSMSMPLKQLCCIINQRFEDRKLQVKHLEPMYKILWFLNTKGIFHCDIKLENIMLLNDTPRLVDFGSVKIDDDSSDTFSFYSPTKFVNPFIHLYFTNKETKRGENTIAIELQAYFKASIESFITSNKNTRYFTQYMLHKKDCFDFAAFCFAEPQLREQIYSLNGGGIFSSCFGAKCDEMKPTTVKIQNNDTAVRERLIKRYSSLAPFVVMDNTDLSKFQDAYSITQTGGKRTSSARHVQTKAKQYVQLRSNKRKYLVRHDKENAKYIMLNGKTVHLSTIRNKYVYVKV